MFDRIGGRTSVLSSRRLVAGGVDRVLLFSRNLQQRVMESLGKQFDLQGRRVDHGLSVYGNKGSADQHACVQQLREGLPTFFALFVRVLEVGGSRQGVEPGVTAGWTPVADRAGDMANTL